MVTGKVKFYNVKNMFGFIAGDDGTDYFVHKSGLSRGLKLYENDPVEFEVAEGQKGPKAVNVTKVGEANTPLESDVSPADEATEEKVEEALESSQEDESPEE